MGEGGRGGGRRLFEYSAEHRWGTKWMAQRWIKCLRIIEQKNPNKAGNQSVEVN